MKLVFKTKELERCASDEKYGRKKLGGLGYKLFNHRIQDLIAAEVLEDLRFANGKFHNLTGDRKGQIGCSVEQPYRLIFRALDGADEYDWENITEVEIIEIVNYHGK